MGHIAISALTSDFNNRDLILILVNYWLFVSLWSIIWHIFNVLKTNRNLLSRAKSIKFNANVDELRWDSFEFVTWIYLSRKFSFIKIICQGSSVNIRLADICLFQDFEMLCAATITELDLQELKILIADSFARSEASKINLQKN